MFFSLLAVTFIVALGVSALVVALFNSSIKKVLSRVIKDDVNSAWHRYITFASFVVGISGGVRIYNLERYINPPATNGEILILNSERWTLEVYRTVIETLQSIAWMYLVVFVVALIAFVIVRATEAKYLLGKNNNE
ncbi:hypothetical protein ACFQDN_21925 [Pseudomonas asuensis]|uniref:Uncharacterized protein n=1 Tax=Pseudomonas asuensis TaxID=1825787 RepID=A0ABQ2H185_9PSED|nr:hypothetical protein [Pseudomonas asuensis]GGM25490.1 hypothetical protein GCM10009425_40300 [Pseudomonas asuensis]